MVLLPLVHPRSRPLGSWIRRFEALKAVHVTGCIEAYRPTVYPLDPANSLLPVTRLRTRTDLFKLVDDLLRDVVPLLTERLDYTRVEAYRLVTMVCELCQNIFSHPDEQIAPEGYVTLQADSAGLKFAVMNAGPGIADQLESRLSSIDGRQAIYLACREGVSSEDSGGLGLSRTVQLVQQAGGCLYIHSGRDRVIFDSQRAWISQGGNLSSRSFLWGTQIGIILPKKTRR
jgi:anti-sigma regulatory factor (Ser/Thr protein kinase)